MSAERIYIVATPTGTRLVRASLRSQALSHVAQSQFTVKVASQDDLVSALSGGVKVENYRNPDQQNLDLAAE
jgi:hypothetical protein